MGVLNANNMKAALMIGLGMLAYYLFVKKITDTIIP